MRESRSNRSRVTVLACLLCSLLSGVSGVWAGDGVVALQTAASSCADPTNTDRYIDCGNGTVTDNDTGLVWLKQANCLATCSGTGVPCTVDSDCGGGTCDPGTVDWFTAMGFVAGLSDKPAGSAAAADDCGLSDGSSAGEWRLPSVEEWEAMIADAVALGCTSDGFGGPSITDDSGTQCWEEGPGNSFTGVASNFYWSPSTVLFEPSFAWIVFLSDGNIGFNERTNNNYVWPVRGGQ